MALRDDFVVRSKLPPTPVPENKSTPKSRVTPHLADKSPLQSQGIGKSSPAPYSSPYPLRRTNILIQTNCLTFSFLQRYGIEPRPGARARDAMPTRLFRHSLAEYARARGRRGARRRRAPSGGKNPGQNLVRILHVSASEESGGSEIRVFPSSIQRERRG